MRSDELDDEFGVGKLESIGGDITFSCRLALVCFSFRPRNLLRPLISDVLFKRSFAGGGSEVAMRRIVGTLWSFSLPEDDALRRGE